MARKSGFEFDALSNHASTPDNLDDLGVDINALGQALDTTWGRSSTPRTNQNSVKFSLTGNVLIASYAAIIQFGSERQMIDMKRRYNDESIRIINANVKAVKDRYKSLADGSLSTKELETSTSLEIISTNFHNPCRKAYFRRKTAYEIS